MRYYNHGHLTSTKLYKAMAKAQNLSPTEVAKLNTEILRIRYFTEIQTIHSPTPFFYKVRLNPYSNRQPDDAPPNLDIEPISTPCSFNSQSPSL